MLVWSAFVTKYLDRIGLDPSIFHKEATPLNYDSLCQLTEAHLSSIPFENLAQHGGYGGPVQMDLEWISEKILDRRRGGFCLELNSLLSSLLEELGLAVVVVPAVVYREDMGGFDHPATHIILVTMIPNGDGDETSTREKYFVDVGFGEPPCNPLRYEFDTVQTTSEGMISRFVESNGKVTLEWLKNDEWLPRLRWDLDDSLKSTSPRMKDLQSILDLVYDEKSNFSRKLIVCRLTRETKLTLAGSKLKKTSPRYPDAGSEENQQIVISEVKSLNKAREVLATQFGIDPKETENMHWELVSTQDPELFAQM